MSTEQSKKSDSTENVTESSMSTLTSPNDMSESEIKSFVEHMKQPPLTDEETKEAAKELIDDDFTRNYNKYDRLYSDPSIGGQDVCLVSFIPSKDSKPDVHGIYGMVKVRGSYGNDNDARERAEFLLKNVDSRHKIYQTYVGRPFPTY